MELAIKKSLLKMFCFVFFAIAAGKSKLLKVASE